MFKKDPEERITLQKVMEHDWVSSNGIRPFPKVIYPKLELEKGETMNAFSKVKMVSMIKIRMKNKLKKKRETAQAIQDNAQ
mmetsp:Transcript_2276/g.1610  ORF Transcript_2276/g.1610 Transcript_2276/m.1610 type:complete len:81 (+) Transcript_2276:1789-2031(+)